DEIAEDELWDKASCKGGRLVAAMLGTDEDAGKLIDDKRTPPSAASHWQGDLKSELAKWGWTDFPTNNLDDELRGDFDGFWHVESVTHALRLNGKPGKDNVVYHVEHWDPHKKDFKGNEIPMEQQTYEVDGKTYRATGARYLFVVNYLSGVIYAQYVTSPMHGARYHWYRDAKNEELPSLNKMSDILWGYWFRNNPNVRSIKYFWVQDIANFHTSEIIARVLHDAGKKLSVWPGATFDMKSEAGQAILGSDNGASFAWFLLQHKAQLGQKWISKVSVFMNDKGDEFQEPDLIFHVEDRPPP
ncbi:hypothetical protein CC80DRAFT_362839, partial [Byssothecium circinans]